LSAKARIRKTGRSPQDAGVTAGDADRQDFGGVGAGRMEREQREQGQRREQAEQRTGGHRAKSSGRTKGAIRWCHVST
jgi:hypothetical protein